MSTEAADAAAASTAGRSAVAPPRRRAAWVAAIVVGYAVVMLVRRPAGLLDPTIWAEDGRLFLAGSFEPLGNLFQVYAGQLWLLPRLVAAIVAVFPAQWWPLLLYLASCLGVAAAISIVLSERAATLLGAFGFRVAAGFALVLLPGVWEVQGNLANLHWWATVAAMVLIAMPAPRRLAARVVEVTFLVVVALTGLGGLLLLPVALWRVLTERSRYLWLRSGVVAGAAAVNLALAMRFSARADRTDPIGSLPAVADFLIKRVAGTMLVGERGLARFWVDGGSAAAVLTVLALALLAVVALLMLTDLRGPSWAWLATGVACVGLAMASALPSEWPSTLTPYISGRYTLLATAAIVLVAFRALALGAGARRWLAVVALALMVPGLLIDSYLKPLGPGVPEVDLVAFQQCLDEAPEYVGAPICFVPIQPATGDWKIVVWREGVPRELPPG